MTLSVGTRVKTTVDGFLGLNKSTNKMTDEYPAGTPGTIILFHEEMYWVEPDSAPNEVIPCPMNSVEEIESDS